MASNKLKLLSRNLRVILVNLANNADFSKLIYYDQDNPIDQPNLTDPSVIIKTKLFPMPFSRSAVTSDCSGVYVYYLDGKVPRIHENLRIVFDIVVAKNLWIISETESGQVTSNIRPYRIMDEIINTLDNISIDTLGRLHFDTFRHVGVDDNFEGIRLIAEMKSLNGG